MSPTDRCKFVEYACERRQDAQLTEAEVAEQYFDTGFKFDALVALHELVETPAFKDRIDVQHARGDDVSGWLAGQQYTAEDQLQRAEAEVDRRESPSLQAMINATRRDKQKMSDMRQLAADACRQWIEVTLAGNDAWHASNANNDASPCDRSL